MPSRVQPYRGCVLQNSGQFGKRTLQAAKSIQSELGNDCDVKLVRHKYKPPFRSPTNFCLVEGKKFGDFTMDVECEQTSKEYGHRDMVFVFGFESPSKFYYAHIATKGDDHANQIFIVNEDARKKITTVGNTGNDWGKPGTWKKVRIDRKIADGSIKVYFDDMTKTIMEATDKSFGAGHLGFGTFDDTCRVRKVTVRGTSAEDAPAPKFLEPKK